MLKNTKESMVSRKSIYSCSITLSSAAVFKANFYGILCEANHKKAT